MRYMIEIYDSIGGKETGHMLTPSGRVRTFSTLELAKAEITKEGKRRKPHYPNASGFLAQEYIKPKAPKLPRVYQKKLHRYEMRTPKKGLCAGWNAVVEIDGRTRKYPDLCVRYVSKHFKRAQAILDRFNQGAIGDFNPMIGMAHS